MSLVPHPPFCHCYIFYYIVSFDDIADVDSITDFNDVDTFTDFLLRFAVLISLFTAFTVIATVDCFDYIVSVTNFTDVAVVVTL